MEIDDRLKKFIFKKLSNDLSRVEVIPYDGSIWFIDRDNKYWILELDLEDDGHLWWRYDFFYRFFQVFSLREFDYEPLIAEWVEQILNKKINTIEGTKSRSIRMIEDVLNNK
jgi:hypothetical protein